MYPEITSKQADFNHDFLQLKTSSLQKYRIRYILAKFKQWVDQKLLEQSTPNPLDPYMSKGIEIEHILPNSPTPELRAKIGDVYDSYKIWLGNLCILEKPMNIVASNSFFIDKAPIYRTSRFYLTRSISQKDTIGNHSSVNRLNAMLKSFDTWGPKEIEERQKMLLKLAQQVWSIDQMQSV